MYKYQEEVEISKMMLEAAGVEICQYNPDVNLTKENVQETTENIQKMLKRYSPKPNTPK